MWTLNPSGAPICKREHSHAFDTEVTRFIAAARSTF
jgi:hypothetical protein